MNSLDWYEIKKAKKMVKANRTSSCGNAIAEYRDNIVRLEHVTNFRKYVIPISKVEGYDETERLIVWLLEIKKKCNAT